jgi:hypothetical protein
VGYRLSQRIGRVGAQRRRSICTSAGPIAPLVMLLMVVLFLAPAVAGCGSSPGADEDSLAPLIAKLQLNDKDAATLAEIQEILVGMKNGTVVVREGLPSGGEIPTDVEAFLDMIGYKGAGADSSAVSLEGALFFLQMMTTDLRELDRVHILGVFGLDQCLGWNPLLNYGEPGPSPLRCFASDGRELWSVELGGYGADWVCGSPEKNVAAVLGTKWVTSNDRQYAVMLVTSDPSLSSEAQANKPATVVLRELPPPDDGFYAPQIAIARDGTSVGLYVMRSYFDSDGKFADESTAEVMNVKGDTLWRVALPQTCLSFPNIVFDQALSTAALVMADRITDENPDPQPYILLCRQPGRLERLESSKLGMPSEARMQEVSISPDGKMLAIKSYGFPGYDGAISLCSLEPQVKLKWTVHSDCERAFFSADGRTLVCAYGSYDSDYTWESIREVQVLSTADGSVLWEKTERIRDKVDMNDSSGSSMWDFAPAFIWQGLANPQSVLLVDLQGAQPMVKTLDRGVSFPVFVVGNSVIVGLSEDGTVSTVPWP